MAHQEVIFMLLNCLAVGAGGAAGAISRYLLGLIPVYTYMNFPVGTMLINLTGAFCIGFIAGVAPTGNLTARQILLLKTGFCGGFTTFSTFSLETLTLMEQGRMLLAGTYAIGSVLVCLAGVMAGKMAAAHVIA